MAKPDDEDDKAASGAAVALPLERLARLIRAGEHGHGLNPAQWEALRYLARANRFSNAPGALTRYLGATKGTVSQTLKSLAAKGLIAKTERPREKRSVVLVVTEKGHEMLGSDPWAALAAEIEDLGGKTRRRMARGLAELLAKHSARAGLPPFGTCPACRYFREKMREGDPAGPHFCMLYDAPLSLVETGLICVGQEQRA